MKIEDVLKMSKKERIWRFVDNQEIRKRYRGPTATYKGIVKIGNFKEYEFYILKIEDYKKYFDLRNISFLINPRINKNKIYKGCRFEIIDEKEVPENYPVMTDEIMEDIEMCLK